MSTPILKAENLIKCFGFIHKKTSVDGFNIQINSGEIIGLLGGNGAGKSTTFDMLSGLTKPTSGTISLYDEQNDSWRVINNDPLYKRAQHGICYLPQKPSVFASLTARQNLLGIMEIMPENALMDSMKAYDSSLNTREEFCDALLERFDLIKCQNRKMGKLSGGEKRKLEIARSFIRRPRLILMDEPYAAVDLAGIELCRKMLQQVRNMGVSILLVDHRVDEVLRLSDRVIFLHKGKIYAEGKPYEIVRVPLVRDTLLLEEVSRFLKMFPVPAQTSDSADDQSDQGQTQVAANTQLNSVKVE